MSYGFVSFVLVFLAMWALVAFLIAAEAIAEETRYQQKGGDYEHTRRFSARQPAYHRHR